MFNCDKINKQTREQKIKIFSKNQKIAIFEALMYDLNNDEDRLKNIFLNLLDNLDITIINSAFFINEGIVEKVKTFLLKEHEIFQHLSKNKKIILYSITESKNKDLVVRYFPINKD